MQTTLFKSFFIFLLVFCSITAYLILRDSPADLTGLVHPDYPSMVHSGSTVAYSGSSQWISLVYGLCVLTCFFFSIWIGASKQGRIGKMGKWLVSGFVIYGVIYLVLTTTWWKSLSMEIPGFFMGFPHTTAWMIYGMWFFPFFFLILYLAFFDSWIFTPEDEQIFHSLIDNTESK
ncbi:MAG: hypothetical protein OEQ53_14000 [Saprospiraceae bacterium]|nr:hypothetical protein [Saprospiraceae bacterium]